MGKINVYICDAGHNTVTRDTDAKGSTAMFLLCRHKDCQLQAMSQFYMVDQNLQPTHEWYKATDEDVKAEMKEMFLNKQVTKKEYDRAWQTFKDHTRRGGLLLRKIETL